MSNPVRATNQIVIESWWGFATSVLSQVVQDVAGRVSALAMHYIPTVALPEDLELITLTTSPHEEERIPLRITDAPAARTFAVPRPIMRAADLFPLRPDRFHELRLRPEAPTPLPERGVGEPHHIVEATLSHLAVVKAARTVASWAKKTLFRAAAGAVVAAPRILEWVQSAPVVPGHMSTTEKVRKILEAFASKKAHETLCVLGETVEQPPVTNPVQLRSRQSHYTGIRTLMSSTHEALEKADYISPLPSAPSPAITPKPLKTIDDKKLCAKLSSKAEAMSTIAILSSVALGSSFHFEQLKTLTRDPNPLKTFFSELPLWSRIKANIVFFFLRPLFSSLFHYQSEEKPGLAIQLVRLLRERLIDPDLRRTLISTLLLDGASTAEDLRRGASSLSPLSSAALNKIFLSWLQEHFVIKTSWPLIGGFIDRFIQKKVFQFVEELNIPQMARSLFNPEKQSATANPIVTRLLKLLEKLSTDLMKKQQTENAAELALLRSGAARDHLDAPSGSVKASFYNNEGEPLDFAKVTKQLTAFLALHGATDEVEKRIYETKSRFEIYLRERQKEAPREAELLASYINELDELLTALSANKAKVFDETHKVSIKDKIEEQVDQIIPPLLHQGLSTIFDLLGDEETTETLLETIVSVGEQLITEQAPTAEESVAQTAEFDRASKNLRENIKQIIADAVELEFTPEVQKERVERSNLYAVQWSERLRSELQGYVRNIFHLSEAQTAVTSSSHVETLLLSVKEAGKMTAALLSSCEKRLDQLYNAPAGAFSEDEILRDMTLIEEAVKQIATLGQTMHEMQSHLLPDLLHAYKGVEALRHALAHLSSSSESSWYTTLASELHSAGISRAEIASFNRSSSSLIGIEDELKTLDRKELILERVLESCNVLYDVRQRGDKNIAAAQQLAEQAVRTAIAEEFLPKEALRHLTDNFSLDNFRAQRIADLQNIDRQTKALNARKDAEIEALQRNLQTLLEAQQECIATTNRHILDVYAKRFRPAIDHITALSTTLFKEQKVAVELLPEVRALRLRPLVDGYLSFMGSSLQAFISSPRNLHLILERQLDRLARRLG